MMRVHVHTANTADLHFSYMGYCMQSMTNNHSKCPPLFALFIVLCHFKSSIIQCGSNVIQEQFMISDITLTCGRQLVSCFRTSNHVWNFYWIVDASSIFKHLQWCSEDYCHRNDKSTTVEPPCYVNEPAIKVTGSSQFTTHQSQLHVLSNCLVNSAKVNF